MRIQPYRGTNRQIEVIASRLRSRVDSDEVDDVSSASLLRQLVGRMGGEIEIAEDPSDQEMDGGSLVIRGRRDFTIFLSPYTTPLRDNFTIAHELGHYVLHYVLADQHAAPPLCFARYGSSPIEWQANRFAAALLMPQEKFRETFRLCEGNIPLLSGLFDVSLPAVQVRAKSLGLLE